MSELQGDSSQFYFISIIYLHVSEAHVTCVGVRGRRARADSPFPLCDPKDPTQAIRFAFPAEQSHRLTATVLLRAGVRSQEIKCWWHLESELAKSLSFCHLL